MEGQTQPSVVEPPRGTHPARVDEKGRLKLPAQFQQYLSALGEEKVFITSLDAESVSIYPISLWKQNEALLEAAMEDPDAADSIAFLANDMGADAEMDSQGRLLIKQELRQMLSLENQTVFVDCQKGCIHVYSKDVYEARRQKALANLEAKLRTLKQKGLK